ncbi:MAG: pseudouridine synthase [Bacillota bacterium]
MPERLQKILARAGVASRRSAEQLILAGRVRVNGETVTHLGTLADAARDRIEVDGVRINAASQRVYLALHKPKGYLTTVTDPAGRPTVMELCPEVPGLHPVGRLDRDSEGLLFLTNDGEFTYAVTHPSHGLEKEYRVHVRGVPDHDALGRLEAGVELEDGPARCRVRLAGRTKKGAILDVVVVEGRNRLVRRICDTVGHPVQRLVRTRIGPVLLGRLRRGQWRSLTRSEVRAVLSQCHLEGIRAAKKND